MEYTQNERIEIIKIYRRKFWKNRKNISRCWL